MPKAVAKDPLDSARRRVAKPVSFDLLCEKLGPKGKLNAERHLATCQAGEHGAAHADNWKRLGCAMMTLASHAAKLNGQQSLQFYVADGKYRMQVFALEDLRDGNLTVYCADILDKALAAGVFEKGNTAGNEYRLADSQEVLTIERLDRTTSNPADFFKDMLGWNRKALRITFPAGASGAQIAAAELVCALSLEPSQKTG